jgi:hypothetical protein
MIPTDIDDIGVEKLLRQMAMVHPELDSDHQLVSRGLAAYATLTKRTYRMPPWCYSFSRFIKHCFLDMMMFIFLKDKQLRAEGRMSGHMMKVFTYWVTNCQPMLVPRPEIIEALTLTDPPEDMLYKDFKWPYPVFAIALPQGMFKTPAGESVRYLLVQPSDETSEDPERRKLEIIVIADMVCFYRWIVPDGEDNIKAAIDWSDGRPVDVTDTEEDMLKRLMRIVFSVVLYIMACPEDMTAQSMEKRIKPKYPTQSGKKAELWLPHIIGEKYMKMRSERERAEKGTHASPRTHWRRGHYRTQRHGEGRKEVKITFIKPVLVNKPKETNEE